MKNIKKYLLGIVMMVVSMTAFAQEDAFSGDWQGANKEGDLKVALTLNCDGNWQLNPYNENARCNGLYGGEYGGTQRQRVFVGNLRVLC